MNSYLVEYTVGTSRLEAIVKADFFIFTAGLAYFHLNETKEHRYEELVASVRDWTKIQKQESGDAESGK